MEKDLHDIIIEKEYFQLTNTEREALKELFSTEAEYVQLRDFLLAMEVTSLEAPKPSEKTSSRLNELFDELHGTANNSETLKVVHRKRPFYRQPWLYGAAAVILVLIFVIPLTNNPVVDQNQDLVAQADTPKDEKVLEKDVVVESSEVEGVTVQEPNEIMVEERIADAEGNVSLNFTLAEVEVVDMDEELFEHPDWIVGDATPSLALTQTEEEALMDLLTATF